MPRIRYTAEVRQQALSLVLDAQTPIVQVAHDIGCSINTLHNWIKQHRQQDDPSVKQQEKAMFVPVNIIDARQHPVEIVMPNGISIRVTDISPRYLAELLNVLASC
jgi:transposase-like protein